MGFSSNLIEVDCTNNPSLQTVAELFAAGLEMVTGRQKLLFDALAGIVATYHQNQRAISCEQYGMTLLLGINSHNLAERRYHHISTE
jgi:hypothetical protein